jgi:hypothetical protein
MVSVSDCSSEGPGFESRPNTLVVSQCGFALNSRFATPLPIPLPAQKTYKHTVQWHTHTNTLISFSFHMLDTQSHILILLGHKAYNSQLHNTHILYWSCIIGYSTCTVPYRFLLCKQLAKYRVSKCPNCFFSYDHFITSTLWTCPVDIVTIFVRVR